MIRLTVEGFQWIKGAKDDPNDQCAHGRVDFRINNTQFVKPEDGVWTVSMAALYLLRTLTEDHLVDNPVAEMNSLFPCCGFNVWPLGTRFKVMAAGCATGVNPEVLHSGETVTVRSDLGSETVPIAEWRTSVMSFADSVRAFYKVCTPKSEIQDEVDRQGWRDFWEEWAERTDRERSLKT